MDQSKQPTSVGDKPGAPELDSSVKTPKTVPAKQTDKQTETASELNTDQPEPAFRPNPTHRGVEASPVNTDFTTKDHKKRTEFLKSVRESRPKRSHFWRNLSLALIGLAAIAAVFAWVYFAPDSSQEDKSNNSTPSISQQTQQQANESVSDETETFAASSLPVELAYPAGWSSKEENGILTITSPVTELTAASGNKVLAIMKLIVQPPKEADLTAFDEGSVVAVLESDKISYESPAPAQQGSTYVSFLQYPKTTTKGGLDAIYITGNSGYVYSGKIYKDDLMNVEPLIGLTFLACGNSDCPSSTQEPLAISSDMWKQESFNKPITDMFKSFRISS